MHDFEVNREEDTGLFDGSWISQAVMFLLGFVMVFQLVYFSSLLVVNDTRGQ